MPSPRRTLTTLFLIVFTDLVGFGIVIPLLPLYAEHFHPAPWVFGLLMAAYSAMQFVFSPVLGALSDRFGRRPVVLLSNLGLGLDYLVMALAPSLPWLLVGRLVSGITGASFTTAGAYIADVTPPERRAAGYGLQGAAFGIGFVLGPALGGLLGTVDPRLPFWVASGLSLANFAYGLLILPESLPVALRTGFSWRRANPVGSLRLLRSHPELSGLAAVLLLSFLAHEVLPSTFVLYASYRYGWDQGMVGATLAGIGLCGAIVQGGLVRPVVARVGERRAALVGLACGAVGFAIYGLAPTGEVFWLGAPIMALWGFFTPSAQSLMTRRVGGDQQGQLQGAVHSLRGISGLIGPGLFTFSFAAAIAPGQSWHLPGTPFLLAAALLACATPLVWRVTRRRD